MRHATSQQIDRHCRQRPRHVIAAYDDQVDVLAFEVGEDGAQRDGIAMDVKQGRDPHPAIERAVPLARQPSSPCATGGMRGGLRVAWRA